MEWWINLSPDAQGAWGRCFLGPMLLLHLCLLHGAQGALNNAFLPWTNHLQSRGHLVWAIVLHLVAYAVLVPALLVLWGFWWPITIVAPVATYVFVAWLEL